MLNEAAFLSSDVVLEVDDPGSRSNVQEKVIRSTVANISAAPGTGYELDTPDTKSKSISNTESAFDAFKQTITDFFAHTLQLTRRNRLVLRSVLYRLTKISVRILGHCIQLRDHEGNK